MIFDVQGGISAFHPFARVPWTRRLRAPCVYVPRRPVVEGQAQSGRAAVSGSKFNERTLRPSALGVMRDSHNARARAYICVCGGGWRVIRIFIAIEREKERGREEMDTRIRARFVFHSWGKSVCKTQNRSKRPTVVCRESRLRRKRTSRSCLWVSNTFFRTYKRALVLAIISFSPFDFSTLPVATTLLSSCSCYRGLKRMAFRKK